MFKWKLILYKFTMCISQMWSRLYTRLQILFILNPSNLEFILHIFVFFPFIIKWIYQFINLLLVAKILNFELILNAIISLLYNLEGTKRHAVNCYGYPVLRTEHIRAVNKENWTFSLALNTIDSPNYIKATN